VVRRAGIVALCVLSLAACVGLAWWQWTRFESATGTWQNLGYVLQWPLFGIFPAFMVWRLSKLRAAQREDEVGAAPAATPVAPKLTPGPPAPPAEREDGDDPELAAYNRYLAELDARHQEKLR
jgi:DNA-binding transcriptional regulator of glucitol operon